jgi:segregation and condensation protein B
MSAPDEAPPVARLVEALLFVGGGPLTATRAAEVIRGLTAGQLAAAADGLNRLYRRQGRPYRVQTRDGGYELALLPRYRGVQERLYGTERAARLSPAALDVLALVAYRQPATRPELEAQRGADCGAPLRQLLRLGLVSLQRDAGGAASYATTPRFLTLFNLRSLDDLPRTQDLQQM